MTFPERITAEVARIGGAQLLLASSCRKYDEETMVEVLLRDALTPGDPRLLRRLIREMVNYQTA